MVNIDGVLLGCLSNDNVVGLCTDRLCNQRACYKAVKAIILRQLGVQAAKIFDALIACFAYACTEISGPLCAKLAIPSSWNRTALHGSISRQPLLPAKLVQGKATMKPYL